jgi:hypothetical protein
MHRRLVLGVAIAAVAALMLLCVVKGLPTLLADQ